VQSSALKLKNSKSMKVHPPSKRVWPPPPGPLAVVKSKGSTPTERYLAELAEHTFLSMWSYPNLWREQRANSANGDGKELCDLLVVFDEHLIIFSDKLIEYKQHHDPVVSWCRWYRASIKKSADQVFGAERWIRKFPDRIFLDSRCTKRFPVALVPNEKLIIHRIVVARGAGAACRAHFGGGSGSLMIAPDIIGDGHLLHARASPELPKPNDDGLAAGPFMIGQIDPDQGYVHVLDDVSLDVLMSNLDTVQDFVNYLVAKERFALSGRLIGATGEEDLLAYYLKRMGTDQKHEFVVPAKVDGIMIDGGYWDDFQNNPQRLAQIEADKISYIWDDLIERFAFHALNDSQYYTTDRGTAGTEPIVRFLARETRIRRRLLSHAILGLVERTLHNPDRLLQARVIEPSIPSNPYYVFLTLRRPGDASYETYREVRRDCLAGYLKIVKAMRPDAMDVVGVAFDTNTRGCSEDLAYLDARIWSEDDQREAEELQRDTGFLIKVRAVRGIHKEYPDTNITLPGKTVFAKGSNRNQPCFCGSNIKYKRCHGR
jgi:hypothetical protein